MKKYIKQAIEFISDGCTYSPDFNFYHCCEDHDWCYHTGEVPRKIADKKLRECIKREGHTALSWIYWAAVRIFGRRRYNRGREINKMKLFFLSVLTMLLFSLCGQALASGNIIERGATNTETVAQTRDDIWLTPASIPYFPADEIQGLYRNERNDTYSSVGDLLVSLYSNIKRCILADNGTVVYYLDPTSSYNREGVLPSVSGTDDAGTAYKVSDANVFTGPASDYVGHYVHNKTDDTYSMITAKDSDSVLSIQDDIFDIDDTFEICTAVLNGDDGQVMVEIPAFYHKYWYSDGQHRHLISLSKMPGYELHPAFQKNGDNVTARYIGAYEGVLYDTSKGKYVNGLCLPSHIYYTMSFNGTTNTITSNHLDYPFSNLEAGVDTIVISGTQLNEKPLGCGVTSVTDTSITVDCDLEDELDVPCLIMTQIDWENDVLSSVAGKAPITCGTRAQFRTIAANRDLDWRQQDYDLISAIQLLYLVEYENWYSQSEIGAGLTDWTGTDWSHWNNFGAIEKTGLSNIIGNATGNVSNGSGVEESYMSYRGIENFYGHLWKWVDGINIYEHVPYVCNNDVDFADDTMINYTSLGVTLSDSNGWQKTLAQISRGFLPVSVGGSSSTYITDYYWQDTGWRVVGLGGCANDDTNAGIAYWNLLGASSGAYSYATGRLCY